MKHIELYSDIFRCLCNPCIYNRAIFKPLTNLEPKKSCAHLWLKVSTQIVVLRVSRRTNSKTQEKQVQVPFFLVFLTKYLSKCPSSTKLTLPWKLSCCAPALRHYYFCKTLHLTWWTVLWIRFSLESYSITCTVTFCHILHQTDSQFWHIRNSVYSGIFRHIQAYSALLTHIHAYWCIVKVYLGLFRTLCNPRVFRTLPYYDLWHIWNRRHIKTLWNSYQAFRIF